MTTTTLEAEYDLDGIDVLIRVYDQDSGACLESGTLPVLWIADEMPTTPADLFSQTRPTGVVLGDVATDKLYAALAALAAGFSLGPPVLVSGEDTAAAENPGENSCKGPELTVRELEVLKLLSFGMANKEIAWELSISDNTVKFHVSSIFAKLRVDNRVSAIRAAIEVGLLDL